MQSRAKSLTLILGLFFISLTILGQTKDKAEFRDRHNPFFEKMMKEINSFTQKSPRKSGKSFALDFSGKKLPKSKDEFAFAWHNKPHSQGFTGTCWSHAATSFFESEVYRMHKKKVRLSEMFTVYWEYVAKASAYVDSRGKTLFAEGSEGNAVTRIYKKYGIVPQSVYSGMHKEQKFHDHRAMFREMNGYLKSVKQNNAWNKDAVIATIKSIMDKYMGTPPAKFYVDGNEYSPNSYLKDYLKLDPDNYIDILSYMQKPYYRRVEYEVADNWWHDSSYFNVPLDKFMEILKRALKNGYTASIGGDVSEPGIDGKYEAAIVPTFDIPAEYIDEYARQFRFSNHTTTDDHGIHAVGYKIDDDGKMWFLIKDSGGRAFQGPNKGYMFYREDYVKLKIMDFMIPKELVEDLL